MKRAPKADAGASRYVVGFILFMGAWCVIVTIIVASQS